MEYSVTLNTLKDGKAVSKTVYANMSEADASKVCERMNRLNAFAGKYAGKTFNFIFSVIKNGK